MQQIITEKDPRKNAPKKNAYDFGTNLVPSC